MFWTGLKLIGWFILWLPVTLVLSSVFVKLRITVLLHKLKRNPEAAAAIRQIGLITRMAPPSLVHPFKLALIIHNPTHETMDPSDLKNLLDDQTNIDLRNFMERHKVGGGRFGGTDSKLRISKKYIALIVPFISFTLLKEDLGNALDVLIRLHSQIEERKAHLPPRSSSRREYNPIFSMANKICIYFAVFGTLTSFGYVKPTIRRQVVLNYGESGIGVVRGYHSEHSWRRGLSKYDDDYVDFSYTNRSGQTLLGSTLVDELNFDRLLKGKRVLIHYSLEGPNIAEIDNDFELGKNRIIKTIWVWAMVALFLPSAWIEVI